VPLISGRFFFCAYLEEGRAERLTSVCVRARVCAAIAVGAISVEADVWLYNSTLFVGHHTSSLSGNRTFASLYIDPLVALLEKQNPSSPFVKATYRKLVTCWKYIPCHIEELTRTSSQPISGVFDASAGQTLYLWVDVKTGANETWAAVKTALEPLREKGYLTTFSGGVMQRGAVTVIGTGNTPLDRVIEEAERDYFVDGPLLALEERRITKEMSPIASCDLPAVVGQVGPNGLSAAQMRSIRNVVKSANERGIKTRLWDLPGWPIGKRNKVWQQVVDAGVYLLNVDDLEAAKSMGGTA